MAGAAIAQAGVGHAASEIPAPMPARDENAVSEDYGFLDDAGTPLGGDGRSAGTDQMVYGEPEPMPLDAEAFDENAVSPDYGLLDDGGSLPEAADEFVPEAAAEFAPESDSESAGEPEPMPALDENPVAEDHSWVDDTDGAPLADAPAEEAPVPDPAQENPPAEPATGGAPDAPAPKPSRRAGEQPAGDFPQDWVSHATKGELDLDKED